MQARRGNGQMRLLPRFSTKTECALEMNVKAESQLEQVQLNGEWFYRIADVDALRPFFMSIVSDSNHWLFVSSNGGISAGRKNPEYALFPYDTDDKITESAETTGSKTILRIHNGNTVQVWEPFSIRSEGRYSCQRNLYKSRYGNKIIFEEINNALQLCFRYEWNTSNLFGFVRKAGLHNLGPAATEVHLLDGIQNVLPYGVGSDLQRAASNLADAYKRTELEPASGLGIFALSAIIVDKAEPSEALKANTVWQTGLPQPRYLLSSLQLGRFRTSGEVEPETDVKGEKGAYFAESRFTLTPGATRQWMLVANVNQGPADVVNLAERITTDAALADAVLADVESGTNNLRRLVYAADGLQCTADSLMDARHFSNVLFNIMRGGIFDDNYRIYKSDFIPYLRKASKQVYQQHETLLQQLPGCVDVATLHATARQTGDLHLQRLAIEYLPLRFSRRHGDPSRPWNQFSINTHNETDGTRILDYQGNWRDIFQNWEALALSYPGFTEGMIYKFLNASTFDGYNPYRVTKDGFDWEVIEPDNPWSYIGYWGDHQVIYLLKLLEFLQHRSAEAFGHLLLQDGFVYAHVPYRIKPYADLLQNPKDTIVFDTAADHELRRRMSEEGADGALLRNRQGAICQAGFIEKILALVLSKLSNFIPDAGIWMNTQRPEWNDANNALVGNGASMVTLYYLRRFLRFFEPLLQQQAAATVPVAEELYAFFGSVTQTLQQHLPLLQQPQLTDAQRRSILDALGTAGSNYRTAVYEKGFSGNKQSLPLAAVLQLFQTANRFLEHSIRGNRRTDGLYHAYNLVEFGNGTVAIDHLSEMLEGQVAVLSSGYLSASESAALLDALRASALYRADQNSYLLYPNKQLPGFLQKNNLPPAAAQASQLLRALLQAGDRRIVEQDVRGGLHFNGRFRNANDLNAALDRLEPHWQPLVAAERGLLLQLYEQVFHHKAFTGRSGTFFGYEGLGSIYWHMVSKLLLAVQETCHRAVAEGVSADAVRRLQHHFHEIQEGIGVHKPPRVYGAFPTDPYSHTPLGKGAQQPGMTGQVKEDILSRFAELGVTLRNGRLSFAPLLLRRAAFLEQLPPTEYVDVQGNTRQLPAAAQALLFTCCQVPVVYSLQKAEGMEIHMADGTVHQRSRAELTTAETRELMGRTGAISHIQVYLGAAPALC